MFSKEDDKNLRICKIHHKRKENMNSKIKIFGKMLNMMLAILIIGPGMITPSSGMSENTSENYEQETLSDQLLLLDVTYDHTTSTKAFTLLNLPSWIPSNLVSPVDYAHGTLYQRIQVITKPSTKTVKYQMCVFQDAIVTSKHACSNPLTFTGTGTYYNSQSMTSLYQYNNLNWSRRLLKELLAIKDGNGIPITDEWGWAGQWDGSPNFALYYPMKVRFTAIIVPPGGGPPVWPSGGNSVTVTSPNGGDNLVRGITKTISWSSTGSIGTYVKIELLKGGVLNNVIASSTPNDGSYSWTIPSTQTLGTDYKVRITSTSNPSYTDTSNNNFIIGSSASITTVSPNGGENLVRGTTKTVKWSYSGSSGPYVKIELLKGGILNRVITSSTPNDGSYSWTIPSTQTLGTDYKVRITSTSNPSYTDTSNNNFKISAASITVASPNGGENWARGTTHTISWTSAGSPGTYVKIDLLKGGILNRVITSSTPNDGSFSWTVPSTQITGTDYKIKVTSTSNYADISNNNFIIS